MNLCAWCRKPCPTNRLMSCSRRCSVALDHAERELERIERRELADHEERLDGEFMASVFDSEGRL